MPLIREKSMQESNFLSTFQLRLLYRNSYFPVQVMGWLPKWGYAAGRGEEVNWWAETKEKSGWAWLSRNQLRGRPQGMEGSLRTCAHSQRRYGAVSEPSLAEGSTPQTVSVSKNTYVSSQRLPSLQNLYLLENDWKELTTESNQNR